MPALETRVTLEEATTCKDEGQLQYNMLVTETCHVIHQLTVGGDAGQLSRLGDHFYSVRMALTGNRECSAQTISFLQLFDDFAPHLASRGEICGIAHDVHPLASA